MNPEPGTIRASRILGQPMHDHDGRLLGKVADLITETAPDGSEGVVSEYVVKRPWGHLLGYEREPGDRAVAPRDPGPVDSAPQRHRGPVRRPQEQLNGAS